MVPISQIFSLIFYKVSPIIFLWWLKVYPGFLRKIMLKILSFFSGLSLNERNIQFNIKPLTGAFILTFSGLSILANGISMLFSLESPNTMTLVYFIFVFTILTSVPLTRFFTKKLLCTDLKHPEYETKL